MSEIWSNMYIGLSVKCRYYYNESWIFSTNFSAVYSLSIVLKKARHCTGSPPWKEEVGLFTLLPEVGRKSGWWTVVLIFCVSNARHRVNPCTNKSHCNIQNELYPNTNELGINLWAHLIYYASLIHRFETLHHHWDMTDILASEQECLLPVWHSHSYLCKTVTTNVWVAKPWCVVQLSRS